VKTLKQKALPESVAHSGLLDIDLPPVFFYWGLFLYKHSKAKICFSDATGVPTRVGIHDLFKIYLE
tara:strand:- start:257 stop:454 length:198 start_codon:yes stop_codon:yes gene_type:complete